MGNEKLQREFIDNLVGVSDTTKYEYNTKLNQLTSKVKFDAEESDLLEFLAKIKNPNTRTNKAFALIRQRGSRVL
jgi:hypothetical protein